eukprot:Pgem_evm1s16681
MKGYFRNESKLICHECAEKVVNCKEYDWECSDDKVKICREPNPGFYISHVNKVVECKKSTQNCGWYTYE